MNALRPVIVATLAISALALGSTAADASCIQESLTDRAARAEAVAYGRVVRTEGAAVGGAPARLAHFQAERVLKGSVPERFTVALGPDMGGGISVGATSIDYAVQAGTDHTLFLRKRGDIYETDACAGSHAGQPTGEETAFFGAGTAPEPMPPGIAGADGNALALAALVAALAVVAGVAAVAYRRRASRARSTA